MSNNEKCCLDMSNQRKKVRQTRTNADVAMKN